MCKYRGLYSVEETKCMLSKMSVELRIDLTDDSILPIELADELFESSSVENKTIVVISDNPPEKSCIWLRPQVLKVVVASTELEQLYFEWNPFPN